MAGGNPDWDNNSGRNEGNEDVEKAISNEAKREDAQEPGEPGDSRREGAAGRIKRRNIPGNHGGTLLYIVTYDVPATDNATREKLAHSLKAAGLVRAQYSVFMGFLSRNEAETVALKAQAILGSSDADVRVVPVCKHCQTKLLQVGPPAGGGKVKITRGADAINSNYVPKGAKGLVSAGSPAVAKLGAAMRGGRHAWAGKNLTTVMDDETFPSMPAPYLDPQWGKKGFETTAAIPAETDMKGTSPKGANSICLADPESAAVPDEGGGRKNQGPSGQDMPPPISSDISEIATRVEGGDAPNKNRDPGWKPFLLI